MSDPLPVTVSQFRTDFPEFANTASYSDAMLTFWLTAAAGFITVDIWGTQQSFGIELFTAHNASLASRAAASGGSGAGGGPLEQKVVGPTQLKYDTKIGSYADAGFWNLTNYGKQLWFFLNIIGARPMQLTGDVSSPPFTGPGWGGPAIGIIGGPGSPIY